MSRTPSRLSSRFLIAALSLSWFVACGGGGGGSGDDDDDDDDGPADAAELDAAPPDAPTCPDDDPDCWLEDYGREVLGKLTGVEEIAPGVTLAARESVTERDATRTYLMAELERWGLDAELHTYSTGANVMAVLPPTRGDGTAPMLVVGGHFDGVPETVAAADNGTGTAMVMAIARKLATVEPRDRAIAFVFFDQEEIGLIGSKRYVTKLQTDGTAVAQVHNFDMISYDGDRDGAAEMWSPSPELEALYQLHADARGIPLRVVDFEFSDHQSFLEEGFTAMGMCEEFVSGDSTTHYHQPTDTFDKVDFPYWASIARLAFDAISDAAED